MLARSLSKASCFQATWLAHRIKEDECEEASRDLRYRLSDAHRKWQMDSVEITHRLDRSDQDSFPPPCMGEPV